jgi:uroporphyrinogen decarboxylase
LACEVTLQPLRRFDLDAAILFSDILTIPDALGLGLEFKQGEGPCFKHPLQLNDVINLPRLSFPTDLDYVFKAVKTIRAALPKSMPLIGFSGSPWTLATYMIEGGASKDFRKAKHWLYANPNHLHQLLGFLSQTVSDYLIAQVEAGAEVVQIFDTWGGILGKTAYEQFSLAYIAPIVKALHDRFNHPVPVIVFSKGAGYSLEEQAKLQPQALGIDWSLSLSEAKTRVGQTVCLQGNLDPAWLYAPWDDLKQAAKHNLDTMINHQTGQTDGYIFNLGHGILQDTNPDQLKRLVDYVHQN